MLLKELFESDTKHVAFCFGRMNPPTIGHAEVFKKLKSIGGDYKIFVTLTQDKKENPLDYSTKTEFIKLIHPEYADNLVVDSSLNTIGKVCSYLYDQGYRNATFVAGSDRLPGFKKLITDYNGVEGKPHGYYKFDVLDFESSGQRDPDSPGVAGISASKAREKAVAGDLDGFAEATGAGDYAKELYNAVRKGMGIKESVSMMSRSLSEFAPAGGDGGNNYGGDLHDILMDTIQQRYPKIIKQFGLDTVDSTVSNMVVMGTFDDIDPSDEDDLEDAVAEIYNVLEEEGMEEGFDDEEKDYNDLFGYKPLDKLFADELKLAFDADERNQPDIVARKFIERDGNTYKYRVELRDGSEHDMFLTHEHGTIEAWIDENIEEVDRRGFLKGLGAAALAGAGMSAGSAKAEGPLPVMATIKFKLPNGEIKTIKKDLGNSYDYRLDDAKKDLENLLDRKGIKNYTIHLDRYNSDSKTDRDTTMKTDYVDRSPAVGRGSKDDYMDKGPYTAKHSSASYMDRSKEKEFRDMGNY